MEPLADVGLQGLEQLVELGSDLFQELVFLELVQEGAIEALDKAAGLGTAHLRGPVFDVVEL